MLVCILYGFNNYCSCTGQIPHDGEPREDFVTILVPVTVVLFILNISGIIYAVVCFIFNAIFHKKR